MGTTSCYATLFRTTPVERIQVIRRGLPAACVIETSKTMGVSPAHFLATLQLRPASVNRCLKANVPLSAAYSERIVGLYRLIGLETPIDGGRAELKRRQELRVGHPHGFAGLDHARRGKPPANDLDPFEGCCAE